MLTTWQVESITAHDAKDRFYVVYEPRWMSLDEYARVTKAYGPADLETPRGDGVYVYWESPAWVSIDDLRVKIKRGFIYNIELLEYAKKHGITLKGGAMTE
jgi:uncharacterized protein with FMN-binding domain